jgi:hypothetical protein
VAKQRQAGKAIRFKTQRENGGDWCVIDTSRKGVPVANGLELREAEQVADAMNAMPKQTPRVVAVC